MLKVWIPSSGEQLHPSLLYSGHISEKEKPVIRRIDQGLKGGGPVHKAIDPRFGTFLQSDT